MLLVYLIIGSSILMKELQYHCVKKDKDYHVSTPEKKLTFRTFTQEFIFQKNNKFQRFFRKVYRGTRITIWQGYYIGKKEEKVTY